MPNRFSVWLVSSVLAMLSFLMVALSVMTFLAVLNRESLHCFSCNIVNN